MDEPTPSAPVAPPPDEAPRSGLEFNHPTVIALCYLGSFITGVSALIGVVLAYIWEDSNRGGWSESHFTYLKNTFWIGLVLGVAGVLLTLVLIGIPILLFVSVQLVIRSVKVILAAQKHLPMPEPKTLLW